jgi:CheY-like chemotaxis protein
MKKSVLLIEPSPEDESSTLHALKNSNLDNEVAVVRDGTEALDYLLNAEREPHTLPQLVLLNLELPKWAGSSCSDACGATSGRRPCLW